MPLCCLGYNCNPGKINRFMELAFKFGTSKIKVEGTTVVPLPLYKALDGGSSGDYVSRVEPSIAGGEKIGKMVVEAINKNYKVK